MSNSPAVTFAELESAAAKSIAQAESKTTPVANGNETKTETNTSQTQGTPATIQFTEADATALRTLADLGITPGNAAQILQKAQTLDRLPQILRTNARVVWDEMAKSDPEGYKLSLEALSDLWYENWEREHPDGVKQPNSGASSTTASTDPRIESKLNDLSTKLEGLISRQNQEQTQKQNDQILAGYNTAVDELLAKLPKDVPDLTRDHIRLKTNELLWKDTGARDRVAKGVYVDLGSHFAKACALVTADTKAAASSEHERRSGVESRGTREVVPAAENVNGNAPAPGEDSIWGVSGMAADIKRALSAK